MVGDEVQVRSTVDATSKNGCENVSQNGYLANDKDPEAAASSSPIPTRRTTPVTKPLSMAK